MTDQFRSNLFLAREASGQTDLHFLKSLKEHL